MRGAYVGVQDEQFSVISNHLTFAKATGTLIPILAKEFLLPTDPNFPKFSIMKNLRIRSASEQLADYLREEIRRRTWVDVMPGETWFVTHFQLGRDTVRGAMAHLEGEGLLAPQGHGRRRQIVLSQDESAASGFHVRILLYEKKDRGDLDLATLLAQLQEAGLIVDFAKKSLRDMSMQVEQVARFVEKNPADAWVTCACSREVNEWFSAQSFPTLGMYGRLSGLPMAAAFPAMIPSLTAGVRHLIKLGHRRIVMLTREERRKPRLASAEQAFINELEAAGIQTGDYNLPDWEETPDGLRHRIDELFRVSRPTALIFQETPLFIATRSHLADRGIVAPRDISLFASDPDPSFGWCKPVVSHISWDYNQVVRRVVRWAENVARGKEDRSQTGTKSEFIEGGTIGPVPHG
jgi:DNA-binding LacI/PurR family transcriptional regulator